MFTITRKSQDAQSQQIMKLERKIVVAESPVGDLLKLLEILKKSSGINKLRAVDAISRIFSELIRSNKVFVKGPAQTKSRSQSELRQCYNTYMSQLCSVFRDGETEDEKRTALTNFMYFIRLEGHIDQSGGHAKFPQSNFYKLVQALHCPPGLHASHDKLVDEFFNAYVNKYDDYRYYTMTSLKAILDPGEGKTLHSDTRASVCTAILKIKNWPTKRDDLGSFATDLTRNSSSVCTNLKAHNRIYAETWLSLIQSGLVLSERKLILQSLPTLIAPNFSKPELLLDFLTDSLELDESAQMLALSGLYYLITEHNYHYLNFYTKLYSLLTNNTLHSNKRSEFLRCLTKFLSSSHLSSALVASFIKRLVRFAMFAPPAAIIAVVPWVYNLLKRHPTCTFMLHREIRDPERVKEIEANGFEDPFLGEEADPEKTHAIDSCLWEILALQQHWHPSVSTLAKILSQQHTKQQYEMENFLDESYRNMMSVKLSKPLTKSPVIQQSLLPCINGFEPEGTKFEGDEALWHQFPWK